MIKQIKKWFHEQSVITRKTRGLAEKQASTQRKLEVAMSILDQRKENKPVLVERRKNGINLNGLTVYNGH